MRRFFSPTPPDLSQQQKQQRSYAIVVLITTAERALNPIVRTEYSNNTIVQYRLFIEFISTN
jgi:hypothetical protein